MLHMLFARVPRQVKDKIHPLFNVSAHSYIPSPPRLHARIAITTRPNSHVIKWALGFYSHVLRVCSFFGVNLGDNKNRWRTAAAGEWDTRNSRRL